MFAPPELNVPRIAQTALNFLKGKRRNIGEYGAIASDKIGITSGNLILRGLNYFNITKMEELLHVPIPGHSQCESGRKPLAQGGELWCTFILLKADVGFWLKPEFQGIKEFLCLQFCIGQKGWDKSVLVLGRWLSGLTCLIEMLVQPRSDKKIKPAAACM